MPNSVPTNIQYEWHGLITENVKMIRKEMKEDYIIKNTYAVFLRAVFFWALETWWKWKLITGVLFNLCTLSTIRVADDRSFGAFLT